VEAEEEEEEEALRPSVEVSSETGTAPNETREVGAEEAAAAAAQEDSKPGCWRRGEGGGSAVALPRCGGGRLLRRGTECGPVLR
jgi:hypothetical protein